MSKENKEKLQMMNALQIAFNETSKHTIDEDELLMRVNLELQKVGRRKLFHGSHGLGCVTDYEGSQAFLNYVIEKSNTKEKYYRVTYETRFTRDLKWTNYATMSRKTVFIYEDEEKARKITKKYEGLELKISGKYYLVIGD